MDFEVESFLQSKLWIDKNFNATTDDLPDEFLDLWMEEDQENQEPKEQDHNIPMQVFLYAFLKKRYFETQTNPIQIPVEELHELYRCWQVKLAAISVNRISDFSFAPLPLFSFDPNETVTITHRSDNSEN